MSHQQHKVAVCAFCFGVSLLSVAASAADLDNSSAGEISSSSCNEIANVVGGEFGPVDSPHLSIANVAPGAFTFFNDGRVYGLPGTVLGGIDERTHLTGDWGGLRTEMACKGVFINLYTTTAYQHIWGGLNSGDAYLNNTQLSMDLDTGRLGWWGGGMVHFSVEARHGSDNSDVYGAGTLVPTYYGAVLPQPGLDNDVVFTNLFIEQAFGQFGLIVGVIPGLYVPDRTLFGDDWKTNFSSYNFNENPIFTQFYNPQTTTVTASWTPNKSLSFSLGVYDANTDTRDFGKDFFSEVNVYGQATYTYEANGLPGQVLVGGLWSNQDKLNLRKPFTVTELSSHLDLINSPNPPQVTANFVNSSWFVNANFSQYLYVLTPPAMRAETMARGEPLRGLGVFGRVAYSPEDTTAITAHWSAAAFAHGLMDARPDDSFGIGGYYNKISGDLKDGLRLVSNGDILVRDESGIEVFYDLSILPSMSLNFSYQHVWNPFEAELLGGSDSADIGMMKLNITW